MPDSKIVVSLQLKTVIKPFKLQNMNIQNEVFTTIAAANRLVGVSYLGGINISSKLMKNQKVSGHKTYIVYLSPASTSGHNVCSHSTPECRYGCLATSGRFRLEKLKTVNRIEQARKRKTLAFIQNPEFFMRWLMASIANARAQALKEGFLFSVRLNGTADIDYAKILVDGKNIFDHFPDTVFYDYTKNPDKFIGKPDNYHLTLSYSGHNWELCKEHLNRGINVAMVFNLAKKESIPSTYAGYNVIDGDITDLRVDEAKGIIVGLHWKTIADKTTNHLIKTSIFAIQPDNKNINL